MSGRLAGASLVLTLLEWPDEAVPENRTITGRIRIGRQHSPPHQSDWRLADSRQMLSRLHCEIAPQDGAWRLTDHSKHGTFVNEQHQPVGLRGQELRAGDRVRLGDYVIEVRPGVSAGDTVFRDQTEDGGSSWQVPPVNFWEEARAQKQAPPPPERARPWSDQDEQEADNAVPVGGLKLPDDWMLEKDAPPQARPRPPAPLPEPDSSEIAPPPPARPPSASPDRMRGPPEPDALMAAFLRGAGLRDLATEDPVRMMEQVGAAMRALVAGLQQVRASRAVIKREFRIAESVFQPREKDNPLRDVLHEEEALRALLSGRFMPADAIEDVLSRVRLHELALVAAMRDAAESLVESLGPARIAAAAEANGGGGLLADRRRARAWEAYLVLHKQTADALADDFDSVFGKTLARAYERVVQQARADDEPPPRPLPAGRAAKPQQKPGSKKNGFPR
jgi:type VI secretion system protein ImpI/type VI secretion system protein